MTMTSVGGAAVAQAGNATVVVTGTDKDPTIVVATRRGVATLSTKSGQGTAVRGGRLQTLAADPYATEQARRLAQQIKDRPSGTQSADLARQAAALMRGRAGRVVAKDVGRVDGNFSVSAGDVSLGFRMKDNALLGNAFKPHLGDWTSAFASAKPLRGVDITFDGASGPTTVALSGLGQAGRPAQVRLRDRSAIPASAPELQLGAGGEVTALDGLLIYGEPSMSLGQTVVERNGLNVKAAQITTESLQTYSATQTARQVVARAVSSAATDSTGRNQQDDAMRAAEVAERIAQRSTLERNRPSNDYL
jgi:hypothetical protein